MPPSGAAYNVDWVWSFDSMTHVATDRDWFTTFTPLASQVTSTHNNTTYTVEGIGSVEIEVRRIVGNAAKRNVGPKNSKIVLRNVLYVPNFICNVMGNPVREDYDISIGAERWIMDKKTGRGIGMLDKNPAGLVKILLKGQAKGETGLVGNVPERITVEYLDEAIQKCKV
ncbi:hypothetical protein C7974DRAFT_162144 [Boeremia exigua]|uniref:uncharacterized protein n=1 Tax=Boeremia exigua TaxID=749465 RepID=UPI001E8DBCFE|nr:uncharacterized protein C7974DRAFT_162144 [Boeremia exigua]KAH6632911.1 hypothetical protein C7974DRAFT_162144 [Boeremia exigua]